MFSAGRSPKKKKWEAPHWNEMKGMPPQWLEERFMVRFKNYVQYIVWKSQLYTLQNKDSLFKGPVRDIFPIGTKWKREKLKFQVI